MAQPAAGSNQGMTGLTPWSDRGGRLLDAFIQGYVPWTSCSGIGLNSASPAGLDQYTRSFGGIDDTSLESGCR